MMQVWRALAVSARRALLPRTATLDACRAVPAALPCLVCLIGLQAPPGTSSGGPNNPPASTAAAPCSGLTRQEKAKLLWGGKREAAAAGAPPPPAADWGAADFGDAQRKAKFQRLMGAHNAAPAPPPAAAAATAAAEAAPAGLRVLGRAEQARVLADVEAQFLAGLQRAGGRTEGLGL
jgi:hypothetical protein